MALFFARSRIGRSPDIAELTGAAFESLGPLGSRCVGLFGLQNLQNRQIPSLRSRGVASQDIWDFPNDGAIKVSMRTREEDGDVYFGQHREIVAGIPQTHGANPCSLGLPKHAEEQPYGSSLIAAAMRVTETAAPHQGQPSPMGQGDESLSTPR
jgi:hypothetical protein